MGKNILHSLIFILIVATTDAQLLYEQNFNSGLGDMTAIDNDGNDPWPTVSIYGSNWTQFPTGTFGATSGIAISNSWFDPKGIADDWLISPGINISNGAILEWDALSGDNSVKDSYRVLVSTTGPEISNFTDVVLEVPAEAGLNFTKRRVDLSPYNGQEIWIAFNNNSDDRFLLILDNIEVRIPYALDARITEAKSSNSNLANSQQICLTGEQNLVATINNYGFDNLQTVEIEYTMKGEEYEEIVDVNLQENGSYIWTSQETFDFSVGSNQPVITIKKVNGLNDENQSNDVFVGSIRGYPPVPDFLVTDSDGQTFNMLSTLGSGKAVLINFFSSECPDCPDETDDVNAFYNANGAGSDKLEVIGISTNRNDDMDVINALNWKADYPMIPYNDINNVYYTHFDKNHALGNGQVPLYVLVCPNSSNSAFSEIIYSAEEFNASEFQGPFDNCTNGVAVEEVDIISGVNLFPNPVNTDQVTIEFELDSNAEMSMKMVNIHGQIIKTLGTNTFKIGNNKTSIDVSNLDSGVYFLQIIKEEQASNYKFNIVR